MRIRPLVFIGLGAITPCAAAQCGTLWTLLSPAASPPGRRDHATATDTARGRIVLFGGITTGSVLIGDTWEWDGVSWILRANSGPSPRYSHAMSYDSVRQRTVLFGGSALNDTWEWDGQSWTQRMIPGPAITSVADMAFDAARQRTVLIGYQGPGGLDTWEYDGTAWALRATGGPAYLSGLFYDTFHQRCLAVSPGDTRAWTGSAWVIQPSTNSQPFFALRVAYDPVRHRAVGRNFNTQPLATWEWDSATSTWRYRTSAGPSSISGHPFAYDTVSGRTILVGTSSSGQPAETWSWAGDDTAGPAFTLTPVTQQSIEPGSPVTLSAAAISSSPPLTFQWYHFGAPIAPGGIYSGVNTPTLTFTPTSVLHGGTFTLRASDACGMLEVGGYVIVACYPNCDASALAPFLNVNDYVCFQSSFAHGSSYANCDQSTTPPVLNVLDFVCFMNRFAAGCP